MIIPPIKCQGIKTKLTEWIKNKLPENYNIWYEPFMGSGVVGFNIKPNKAIFCDTNPYIINFYNDIKTGVITSDKMKLFLLSESIKLNKYSNDYYMEVRERFNKNPNSYDFIFLNRSCFNGMMRFNSKGNFNVPFCKKNNIFSRSYITKIVNQIKNIEMLLETYDYQFTTQSFNNTINYATKNDIIYCDPPYIDRYSDYFNAWRHDDEVSLFNMLLNTKSKFILSTWHHNKYRKNSYIDIYWNSFNIDLKEHFYYIGGKEHNRNTVIEALVTNF